MKCFLCALAICATLLVPIAVAPILTGCSTTAQHTAVQTLQGIAVTVDKALSAYADRVVAGKVDAPTQAKVATIKTQYSSAMSVAVAAVQGNMSAYAPADLQNIANQLVALIATVTQ